ncbi:hypothetical protein, partial [Mesorhizobium sp. M7A.F.Ca.CA.004.04.2.1]|uniref:hypothetical protein n=1 Tax=Mesorhizobium sp. M7A.F.Ca.CA.004.04.2.1 TaxID=2496677 RepID=UPI0019D45E0F
MMIYSSPPDHLLICTAARRDPLPPAAPGVRGLSSCHRHDEFACGEPATHPSIPSRPTTVIMVPVMVAI